MRILCQLYKINAYVISHTEENSASDIDILWSWINCVSLSARTFQIRTNYKSHSSDNSFYFNSDLIIPITKMVF